MTGPCSPDERMIFQCKKYDLVTDVLYDTHHCMAVHPSKGDLRTIYDRVQVPSQRGPIVPYADVPTSFQCLSPYSCLLPRPAVIWLSTNRNVNVRTTEFCSVGANKLELTTSIVPWRIPDTRTIPTQTENVAVPFVLRPWFDCALLARHNADQATLQAKNSVYPIAKATEFTAHAQYHVTCL